MTLLSGSAGIGKSTMALQFLVEGARHEADATRELLLAWNVYLRDVQHLVDLLLMAWFWGSPIVYQFSVVQEKLGDLSWLYLLNPVTPIVMTTLTTIVAVLPLVVAGSLWFEAIVR